MPIQGARYKTMTTKTGKTVRLAFKGRQVIEAKNMKTGKTHTPKQFSADRAKTKANKLARMAGWMQDGG